ncbi:MAG: peptidase T [Gemmatimonadaceae bacterium]|nr:peptidase T [Chitinophagaceae bacterium]
MFDNYTFTVAERLMRYVQIDTRSDARSETCPSTEKQKDLGTLLVEELLAAGLSDAHLDANGYVYASIPSNADHDVPVICFCAHMDTAPDCSGTGVKPILHPKYDGSDIILPDDTSQVITTIEHPYLLERKGDDIITASGTTLLGADDKAGVAIIMDLVNFLNQHPEIIHGKISVLFTPDEEIGRGVDKVDLDKVGAFAAYTLDGGERGSLEDENFSANGMTVTIHGVSAHPGDAKDKMVNAVKVGAAFLRELPDDEFSPESTDGRYGFVHPLQMEGTVEKATIQFILRDFQTGRLQAYGEWIEEKMKKTLARFPGARAEIEYREQYRNMKEILDQHPQIAQYAEEAITRSGIHVRKNPIRGGTDGSRLSFMGLPCPNIFTGEMALHGKHEYVSVQDMQKSVEVLVNLLKIWEEKSR